MTPGARRVGRARAGAGLLLVLLFGLGAGPDPDDPPPCREAIARHPDATALEALAAEEERVATEARHARREGRKVMRKTLGAGVGAKAQLPVFDALARRDSEARRVGKILCYCRLRRGDPYREDCELLYPAVIP